MVGVIRGIEQLVQALARPAVGLVVHPLAALVHHHRALVFEARLGDRRQQEPHAVGLQPEPEVQVVGGQGLVVVGAIEPGRAVGHPADLLDVAEVLVDLHVLAALEEHVLEEVGEAGPARPLVLRADVVPEVDRHQGQAPVVVEDDPQAVGQGVLGEAEVGFGRHV